MSQYAQVLDRSTGVWIDSAKRHFRPVQPAQQTIYVNGTGIDPPHDWLDDPLVALNLPRGSYTFETAEEYLDTEPVELYNGWLVRQEMSDYKDKGFEGDLHGHISSAARQLKFGRVIPDNMECLLNDGNVIKPDLSMISWQRQQLRVTEYGPNKRPTLMGCPELVVEMRSPSNRRTQEKSKRKLYFENGAKIIWDVDEKKQIIYVYRASSQAKPQIFTMDDEIDCEPLLPGWRRKVSDLFQEDIPAEVMFSEVHDDGKEIGREEGEKIGKKIGREEGEKIGKKIGRVEGEKIGELRTKQDTLIRLLQARFPSLPENILDMVRQTHDITQLDNWFDQAVMAPTLDEIAF